MLVIQSLDLSTLTSILGGRLIQESTYKIGPLTSSLQNIRAGQTLVWNHSDPPDYPEQLQISGIIAPESLWQYSWPVPKSSFLILVKNLSEALELLIQHLLTLRRQKSFSLFAIAGASGIAITAHMLALLLQTRLKTLEVLPRSPTQVWDSYEALLALTYLDFNHHVAVVAWPIEKPEIWNKWNQIFAPDVGILTRIGPEVSHDQARAFLKDLPRAVLESALKPRLGLRGESMTFGQDIYCHVLIRSVYWLHHQKLSIQLDLPRHGRIQTILPYLGQHHAFHLGAVLASIADLGLSLEDLAMGFSSFSPQMDPVQTWTLRAPEVKVFWDQSENGPTAMALALMLLWDLSKAKHRILILGEMSTGTLKDHRKLGRKIALLRPKFVVFVGDDKAQAMADGALSAGVPMGKIRVGKREEYRILEAALTYRLEDADVLFFKGMGLQPLIDLYT